MTYKEKPPRPLGKSEGRNNEAGEPHCYAHSNTHPEPVNAPIKAQGKNIIQHKKRHMGIFLVDLAIRKCILPSYFPS